MTFLLQQSALLTFMGLDSLPELLFQQLSQALSHNTIKLGSLASTRDYTYVSDTVDAFIQIAEQDSTIGKTYNIGSNKEISIGNLAHKICELTNPKCQIITEKKRMRPEKSEVQRLWADNSKAINDIQWAPKISLEKGLTQTINWVKPSMQYYRTKDYVI